MVEPEFCNPMNVFSSGQQVGRKGVVLYPQQDPMRRYHDLRLRTEEVPYPPDIGHAVQARTMLFWKTERMGPGGLYDRAESHRI